MKRIIAVMAALMFAAVLFNINVSALPDGMTAEEYETYLELKTQFERDYLNLLSQYEHGQISYDEFKQYSDEITQCYNELNTNSDGVINSIAQNVSNTVTDITNGIGNAVGAVGDTVKDYIDDVLNPYSSSTTQTTTDMKGGSCAVRIVDKNTLGNNRFTWYYANCTGVIDTANNRYYMSDIFWQTSGMVKTQQINFDSEFIQAQMTVNADIYETVEIYGDWVYSDGSNASTNDNFVDVPIYDFSNATDSELDSVLNNLNEKLKREQPDLTSMEGLLESIYYRLGALDSDNDNALLSDINKAILALSNSNDENAAEIIVALGEIKDGINNMSGDINDNLEDLENNFDKIADFEIPVELFNVDFDSLSDSVKDKVDDIVELITTLVAKGVPMAAINGGLTFYQDIIFNSNEPQDITFDLSFNGEQYNFTILSTSFFGSEGAQALQIIKNFVSIVLGYAWVLAMRKKAASMMN